MRTTLVSLILISIVLAVTGPIQGAVFTDDFEAAHDYVTDGISGTTWDGFLGLGDNETVDALNASVDRPGELYIASTGAYYHEPWEPLGPFLYKIVSGDFVATVKVTDYAGTSDTPVYHNNCGLMVRAFPEDAGDGEDWVAIDYFPIWSCGNFVRSADDDVRSENGHNGQAFDLDPYLQIERVGNTFHFRTSPDGSAWTDMAVSPLVRDDFANVSVQVGLYQATYSTDPGYAAFDEIYIEGPQVVPGLKAYNPDPVDTYDDAPRDTTLSWTSSDPAGTYDVYFGTDPNAVGTADTTNPLDVLVSQGQSDTTLNPANVLEYSKTYYWRVDLIASDGSVYKGDLWSFTVEPFAYQLENVIATTNGTSDDGAGPENTVNGSGLNADDQHSYLAEDMWAAVPSEGEPLYIQYEFDGICKLHELWIWNYNMQFESMLGFSLKDVTLEYSTDGLEWIVLKDIELAQGPARSDYVADTIVDMEGIQAQYVRFIINSGYGTRDKYGLSEVRFFYIAAQASEPEPGNGEAEVKLDDVTLNWRSGREAASHELCFSTSMRAVADGAALLDTVTESSYALDPLELAMTYYWKVNEVNEAEAISRWEGDVWTFSTKDAITLDNFESYDDDTSRIYETWLDGWVNATRATVGYLDAPFAERTIVNNGRQSLPLEYDNSLSPWYSQTERVWTMPQDWTTNAADTLILHFRGYPADLVEQADGSLIVGGAGADIADTTDEFRFIYKQLNGNGSILVRVDSLANTDAWAKAGVMIRESLQPTSRHAMVVVTPGNGVSFQYRTSTGTAMEAVTEAGLTAPYWVKLIRTDDTLTAECSADGVTWESVTDDATASQIDISMIGNVYVGLAVTSCNNDTPTTAEFSNIATTGTMTGQWQAEAIGVDQPSNIPAPLYMGVEDSSGNTATVLHPDPEATAASTWQEWRVLMSEFTSAGVNMTAVRKMVFGVGDPDYPTASGTGLIYVDDIERGRTEIPTVMVATPEDFEAAHDFLTDGVDGTFWDGFLGLGATETVDALNSSLDRPGQLFIASTGAFFHEPWDPIGPFLYKVVEGNFIATVKVSEYAGTTEAPVYHNNCGLMVRAFPEDAGTGEDWVSLDYFPIYACGNFVRSANDDARSEVGHNGMAFGLDPYLQIERVGNTFHFRTSADGITWTEMAVSPMTRSDLMGLPLQIGLFQATYSTEQGYAAFDDFVLETP